MLPVDPAAGRARYDEDGYSLRISWPPRRSLFGGLFIAVWLGGWFFGEKSAIHQLTKAPAHDDRSSQGRPIHLRGGHGGLAGVREMAQ